MPDPTRIDVFDRARRAPPPRARRTHDRRARLPLPRGGGRGWPSGSTTIRRTVSARPRSRRAMARVLAQALAGRSGIETLIHTAISPSALARRGPATARSSPTRRSLPFADRRASTWWLSCLALHWVNDLPGALIQLRRALKPDGLLLGRRCSAAPPCTSCATALLDGRGGDGAAAPARASSPFADVRDAGRPAPARRLRAAGGRLPTPSTVSYPDALALMRDLRAMGEANALTERRRSLSRRAVPARAPPQVYARALRPCADGRVPATFEIVTLTAWAPHAEPAEAAAPRQRRRPPRQGVGHGRGPRRRPGRTRPSGSDLLQARGWAKHPVKQITL